MKLSIKNLAVCAALVCAAIPANAQELKSGYFQDEYHYRFEMNPAIGNRKGFVSFPALGNFNTSIKGNLNLTDLLYVRDGRTVLFTSPLVGAKEAMSNFRDRNRLGTDWKIGIFSFGFNAWGGYNTFAVNANLGMHASMPKSFFSLMKEGLTNKTYSIEDMGAYGIAYGEVMIGHSRDIKQVPGLRVGANLKFLVGLAHFSADFKNAQLALGKDNWSIQSNADLYASVGGLRFKTKWQDGGEYVNGADFNGDGKIGPNGYGMAVDLGAIYKWKDFTFSLGVLDLGAISFKNTQYATTDGVQKFQTNDYTFSTDENAGNSFSNTWDLMRDDIEKLYRLKNKGDKGNSTVGVGTTLNVGVKYELPVYRKLNFGLLSSTKIYGGWTSSEVRLSANIAPGKLFSASVNVAGGTYGWGFGWLLNFHSTGFNFFVGMDRTLGTLSKQFVPLNSNADLHFGINIPFAK